MMVGFPREMRDLFVVALLAGFVSVASTQVLAAQQSDGVSETALRAARPAEWLKSI